MVRGHDIMALIMPGDWDARLSMLAESDDTNFFTFDGILLSSIKMSPHSIGCGQL
jgi:hypothetical protein